MIIDQSSFTIIIVSILSNKSTILRASPMAWTGFMAWKPNSPRPWCDTAPVSCRLGALWTSRTWRAVQGWRGSVDQFTHGEFTNESLRLNQGDLRDGELTHILWFELKGVSHQPSTGSQPLPIQHIPNTALGPPKKWLQRALSSLTSQTQLDEGQATIRGTSAVGSSTKMGRNWVWIKLN